MREYAIVKQTPGFGDLFAFFFGINFYDIETINQVEPEWTDGKYYSNTTESALNSPNSNIKMRAGVYYNEYYDILLVGSSKEDVSGSCQTAVRNSPDTGSSNKSANIYSASVPCTYYRFNTEPGEYFYISQAKNNPLPIIGIKLKPGITPLINPAPNPDSGDDMRSEEPEPDEPKTEPEEPEEPETRSTKKK